MDNQQIKSVLCKHCDTNYLPTNDNFYTSNGKLKIDICKGCKCKKSKIDEKNRKPRKPRVYVYKDRTEYYKDYYLKKKLNKQALKE